MAKKQSIIEFPCQFPIKIVGKNSAFFCSEIIDIIWKHFPDVSANDVHYKESKQKNYLSISVSVYAQNKSTLDALYIELTQHPDTNLVL